MKPFLYELAESIHREHRQRDKLTVVFPNRRAVLYFRKHLGSLLDKPVFSPRLITIEDFISGYSPLKVPDKLELIHRLYGCYNEIIRKFSPVQEPFDKFYFWGEMLLRDFDEADKYMVQAERLFQDLSNQKELDSSFDFLTDEQREFLQSFWSSFAENMTENKQKFLSVWAQLFQLYTDFKGQLLIENIAYEGMMHRLVAENIVTLNREKPISGKIIFAGFNALTKVEERIISYFVEQSGADVYWDVDEYYVNNNTQEAGKFFREYQRHEILGQTFRHIPSNFLGNLSAMHKDETNLGVRVNKKVQLFGAAEPVSQAKVMAQLLQEELERGIDPEDTLIVLPDEKLLLPVLHGLSSSIEKLNVTMGFPLSSTPLFNMVELLVELQINKKQDHFNHRQVLALLGHPYLVAADAGAANAKRKEILSNNWVHIPKSYLATGVPLHRAVFQEPEETLLTYLREIIFEIGKVEAISALDKEYLLNFLKLLNRMEEVIGGEFELKAATTVRASQGALKSFLRLLRQLIQANKIPFTGEPLRGLQVMGVLETRNLDYKNVFVLSLNEGAFPASSGKGSYIPFNIRKAYGLPTPEHQDAMYAYLFYRVLQRAENIFLFYNSETDVLGQGEMSRYLQQLVYESGLPIERKVLHNPIQPRPVNPITIAKTPELMETLSRLSEGNSMFKGISPSALNTYIECRLRFYFRYVAHIKEPKEVEEDLDARVLGNFLHRVMELFYGRIREQKGNKQIEVKDLEDSTPLIEQLIDRVFIEQYRLDPNKPVEYEGQRLVVREIVKRFADRIIEIDISHAPFVMEATEQGGLLFTVPLKNQQVILSGKIDRVDRKDNIVRVIDYKTGKDQLDFENIASLFAREGKRNKAAFQTLLYALLYKVNTPHDNARIIPGLINRLSLFDKDFQFGLRIGKTYVDDVEPLLGEFKEHLTGLLEDLYDPAVPFDQTTNADLCKFCPYAAICYR